MTKEEAIEVLQQDIPCEYDTDLIEALEMAIKELEQEPCEKVAQERYADLCEYFGGAKDILKNRKDFKAWLERVKWHIHKAEELYEKYEYKKEPCEDAISRQTVLDIDFNQIIHTTAKPAEMIRQKVEQLPPIRPQEPKTGHREYNDIYDHYLCENCKTIVMDYDNYCPNCGERLVAEQERSE